MNSFAVIPLGTVSPFCYDGHMCPGFLVKYHDQNILLDCGNGVTNYLQPEDYQNMTIIISHLHPDHYGDLLSIAQLSYVFHHFSSRCSILLPSHTYVPHGVLLLSHCLSLPLARRPNLW